jgi:hypothetical protein
LLLALPPSRESESHLGAPPSTSERTERRKVPIKTRARARPWFSPLSPSIGGAHGGDGGGPRRQRRSVLL